MTELKNTITKVKNLMETLNHRLDQWEEKNSKLEDRQWNTPNQRSKEEKE